MAYRYQPTLYIAGTAIPADWETTTEVVALADLQLDWGRDSVWDKPRPARASVTLIDRFGGWEASDPTLYGAEFRVERAPTGSAEGTGPVVMFRGKIDTIAVRPGTANGERVWFAEVTASDTLAELQKRNPEGVPNASEAYPEYRESMYGPGYWYNPTHTALLTKCNDIITSIASPPGFISGCNVGFRSRDTSSDLLTLIYEQALRGGPIWPQFNPGPRSITYGAIPRFDGGVALNYSSGVLKLGNLGSNVNVDGGKLIATGDGQVTSGMDRAISEVQAKCRVISYNVKQTFATDGGSYSFMKESDGVVKTADVDGWPGSNLLAFDSAFVEYTSPGTPRGVCVQWAAQVSGYAETMNGKSTPPECRFDLERFSYGGSAEQVILTLTSPSWPFVITNTPYSTLKGWGQAFLIIGGTLRWESGWTFDPIFSTIRDPSAARVPVNYGPAGTPWVTNVDAEYQDFDAGMTYADFAVVTRGAS